MKIIFLSSKIVESDLSVEFGEIVPIEIPLLNKKLIYHQIESVNYLSNDIYITLPDNINIELDFDYTRIDISTDKNLVDVLSIISSIFEDHEKLFIYYGDSLLLNHNLKDLRRNYLFAQKSKYKYKWGKINQENYVPAGGLILDCIDLKNAIKNCNSFDDFVSNLQNDKKLIVFTDFKWLDFGHSLTFYNSRRQFLETREFNKIEISNDFIVKSSTDIFKIWSEYKWLMTIKNFFPQNIPFVNSFEIKGTSASYSLEYLYHPVISDIFVFGRQSDDFFIELLENLKDLLIKIQKTNLDSSFIENTSNFYINKLEEREKDILLNVKNLDIELEFVESLIKENLQYFKSINYKNSVMHGDFCFSNILFNFSTFQPILIDPRGFTERKNGNSFFGPSDYDIFKLAHSYVAGYDIIIAGISKLDFFNEINFIKRLEKFISIFEIDKDHLLMGLKHLFLTMIPLHNNSSKRQIGFIHVLKILNNLC